MSTFNLKNKAAWNINLQELLNDIIFDTKINMKDDKFLTSSAVVNLHPKEETNWSSSVDRFYFNSHGCAAPKIIFNYTKTKRGECQCSE